MIEHPPASVESLGAFLESHRDAIMAEWGGLVRQMPEAARLTQRKLEDHLPELLDRIAHVIRATPQAATPEGTLHGLPESHALERLDEGFDLEVVAAEYALLRECVLRMYEVAHPGVNALTEVRRLNSAIDEAVTTALTRYARARERTLVALDRISEAALETADLDRFLPKLLKVLLETTESVDSSVIYLRRGDKLEVAAAVGLAADATRAFSLDEADGFVGKIAAGRQPVELRVASSDPGVKDPVVVSHGLRALYGVPLFEGEQVTGVAQIGSRTAFEFSREDKVLFRAMANRAGALIAQAGLLARESEAREIAERALRELTAAQQQLQERGSFREQFIGILGHDLRNPLNAINASTHLLLRHGHLKEPQLRAVQRIATSAERMSRLIGDVLDFTRGRLGDGIPLKCQHANLAEICRHAIDELQFAHPERKVILDVEGNVEGHWDPDRLGQVVSNLVGNAIQHGRDGTPVQVRVLDRGAQVVMEVSNQGEPIPDGLRPTLFEPFTRASGAASGKSLGLGLYIVKQIVDGHGARIEVRSQPDLTTFAATFPRRAT